MAKMYSAYMSCKYHDIMSYPPGSMVPIAYVFIVLGLEHMCPSSSMIMAMFEVAIQQFVRSMDFNIKTTESETVGGFAGIYVRP